jgi:predicted Zn-dependent protease
MTVKTIQRFAVLIAILGIFGGAAIWTQQYQLTNMAHQVVTRARLAEEKGDFSEADRLYQQHLAVVRDDVETKIQYADLLSKLDNVLKQQEAIRLYTEIFKRFPGRHDLVRKRADLAFKMNLFPAARDDLSILLSPSMNRSDAEAPSRKDGREALSKKGDTGALFTEDQVELLFMMGRCCEAEGDDRRAASYYRAAIETHAPQYLDAYQRLASLMLKNPGKEKEADDLIDKMVKSEPQNYKVYLERGRYHTAQAQAEAERGRYRDAEAKAEAERKRSQSLEAACVDYRQAAKLAPGTPDVILELAKAVAVGKTGRLEARQILKNGLNAAPKSAELYVALANLELQDGQAEKAIAVLERGLEAQHESIELRGMLADILARRGDTGKLLLQIEELKKLGFNLHVIQYLTSYYYANLHQCQKARQILVPLLAQTGSHSPLAVPINLLLARCYSELGETQMQQDAYGRALMSNSGDVTAKLGYIRTQIQQGDIDGAIEGYRDLLEKVPQVRLELAALLIARNRKQPSVKHDWAEVEQLLDEAAKATPDSVAPIILRADLTLARDRTKLAEACALVQEARRRFPTNVDLWNAEAHIVSGLWDVQANSVGRERKLDEALALLKEAERQLGDSVELRLQEGRLWAARSGPQAASALMGLAQNTETFAKSDRRRLLTELAEQLESRQNFEDAGRLWSKLVEEEPDDIGLRRRLIDLAFRIDNKDQIEENIKQIERIEGGERIQGRYWQVRYKIWQIDRAKDEKTRQDMRADARKILADLRSRRPDWSLIPLTLAELDERELIQEAKEPDQKQNQKKLDEQELKPAELDAKQKQEKLQGIVNLYIEAINLGERSSAVVRRVVQLLFDQGKATDALALFNRIPVESQLAGDLGQKVAQVAFEHQDFQRAEEIARKTIDANPGNFSDRLWLVRILYAQGALATAEEELTKAVKLSKEDANRWIILVDWYIATKQPMKAEQAIRETEKNLPQASAPAALAQCCEMMGNSQTGTDETRKAKWYAEAEKWYEKDHVAHPDDVAVLRRLANFLIRTKQFAKAESRLKAVEKQADAKAKDSDIAVWAKRGRALTLILAPGADSKRLKEALALVEPRDQASQRDPEELRILARVLEAQNTPEHRQRAINVLQSLVKQGAATGDDRVYLARLIEASGDWPGAREVYRSLVAQLESGRDLQTLNRSADYLLEFARALLRHHQAGNDQDLAVAEDLIGKLKRIRSDSLDVLDLDVERCRLQKQLEEAANRITSFANRPGLPPIAYSRLAEMAMRLGRTELAERLYKEVVSRWPNLPQGIVWLADFLGRRGQVKEALDLYEPMWEAGRNPESLARLSINAIFGATDSKDPNSPDPTQLSRLAGWLDRALAKNPNSGTLSMELGNIREQQGLYPEAQELYKRAIANGDRAGIAHNNLAWLTVLKDGNATTALEYINQAIQLGGPGPKGDFFDTQGVIYLAAGDKQRAIKDLENAVAIDRTPAKLFHLAWAYLEANDKEKAKRIFVEAKTKGLSPTTLHRLEEPVYRRIVGELGMK